MRVDELPPIEEVPAAHLVNQELSNGWRVTGRVKKDPGATGGCFSVPYHVDHEDGRQAFMKALNFNAALHGNEDFLDQVDAFTDAFKFERDLLLECREKKMSRIITLLDSGTVVVPEAGTFLSQVPYLIFEMADGDIRSFQARADELDCAWAFRAMKHAVQGIEQLHSDDKTHQDVKPSNLLTTENGGVMKLGDLGRADRKASGGPASDLNIPGAIPYAPFEQHFGAFGRTFDERRAADLYLTGSLGVQLFMGHCFSVLINRDLPEQFQVGAWRGSFTEVLPYLVHSHQNVLSKLEATVLEKTQDADSSRRFRIAIGELTDPNPTRRGHPKDHAAQTDSYALRRYVATMELLSRRAPIRFIGERLYGSAN